MGGVGRPGIGVGRYLASLGHPGLPSPVRVGLDRPPWAHGGPVQAGTCPLSDARDPVLIIFFFLFLRRGQLQLQHEHMSWAPPPGGHWAGQGPRRLCLGPAISFLHPACTCAAPANENGHGGDVGPDLLGRPSGHQGQRPHGRNRNGLTALAWMRGDGPVSNAIHGRPMLRHAMQGEQQGGGKSD